MPGGRSQSSRPTASLFALERRLLGPRFIAEVGRPESDFGRVPRGAATFVGAASGGDETSGLTELHLAQRPAAVDAGGVLVHEQVRPRDPSTQNATDDLLAHSPAFARVQGSKF